MGVFDKKKTKKQGDLSSPLLVNEREQQMTSRGNSANDSKVLNNKTYISYFHNCFYILLIHFSIKVPNKSNAFLKHVDKTHYTDNSTLNEAPIIAGKN